VAIAPPGPPLEDGSAAGTVSGGAVIDHLTSKLEPVALALCPDPAAGVAKTVTLSSGPENHQEIKTMKLVKTLGAAFIMSALLVPLFGCEQQQGPGERAGQSLDKALDKTGEQVEKAGDSIQDAAKGD